MATTSTTQSYTCTITRTATNILIVRTPGGKECRIDLNQAATSPLLCDEQRDFLDYLTDGLLCGTTLEQAVTLPEMHRLASIRDILHPEAKTTKTQANEVVKQTASHVHQHLTRQVKGQERSLDAIEGEVNSLQRIWKLANATFWQVEYDIPDRLINECPNPCSWFRTMAIHDTKSTWIFTEEIFLSPDIQRFIADYRAAGCKVRTIKYAQDMVDEVRSRAEEALTNRLRDLHTSLIQNIQSADERLQEAQEALRADGKIPTDKEEQLVWAKRHNRVRQILVTSVKDFHTALECAEKYDTTEQASDLIVGVRSAIRAQTQAFNALMEANGGKKALVSI